MSRAGVVAAGFLLSACLLVVFWVGFAMGYENAKYKYCTHGESSITATKVNGKWVESKPVRTGC